MTRTPHSVSQVTNARTGEVVGVSLNERVGEGRFVATVCWDAHFMAALRGDVDGDDE